jgi:hypothetical protein
MPLSPRSIFFHKSSTLQASDVTAPIPVTTTRRFIEQATGLENNKNDEFRMTNDEWKAAHSSFGIRHSSFTEMRSSAGRGA